jgi:hypothetical protein
VWSTIIADLSVKVFNITAFPQDLEYKTAEDGTRFIIPNAALLKHTKGKTQHPCQYVYTYKEARMLQTIQLQGWRLETDLGVIISTSLIQEEQDDW